MTRDYGKVYTRLWAGDSDFIHLSAKAQRLYMFLISQPDLSIVGTITLALRRWTRCVGDQTTDDLTDALKELHQARFIVVDEGCEELLVRSYIKWDGGWRSPNVMKSIRRTVGKVMSETLRSCLAEELGKLDVSDLSTKVNEKTGRSTRDFVAGLVADARRELSGAVKDPSVMAYGTVSERVSEGVPETVAEGVSGNSSGRVQTEPFPEGFAEGFPKGFLTLTGETNRRNQHHQEKPTTRARARARGMMLLRIRESCHRPR